MATNETMPQIDRYAVMGNPIAHSKSPQIHKCFAEQTGQQMHYDAILVERGNFPRAVADFHAHDGKGLNITVPFKLDARALAELCSPRAELAGSVNTFLWQEDGKLFGDNTDGAGLIRDLMVNHGIRIADMDILLLGAGGAARGVLYPLLEQRPLQLVIANRTPDKAVSLASEFSAYGPVFGGGFKDVTEETFDLVINATAASLAGDVPPIPDRALRAGGCCYDMMYASEPTAFLRWGRRHGAGLAVDGLGMLVEQAAESFFLWRGLRPQTAPVIRALRQSAL
jgi:shikimate dehydrogenase